jgi:hypothetical protein
VNDCHFGYITKSLRETLAKRDIQQSFFNGGNFRGSAWNYFVLL